MAKEEKLFADMEIGEEFTVGNTVWIKFSDTDSALVWDEMTNDWKRPTPCKEEQH